MAKKKTDERIALADLPDVITPELLAAVTGKNPCAVRRQCADGTIPAVKIGSHWYIGRDNVLGPLMGGAVAMDERAVGRIVDAVRERLAAGAPLTIEVRSGNA